MEKFAFALLLSYVVVLAHVSRGAGRLTGICSYTHIREHKCMYSVQFQCFNDKCIPRNYYCDNGNDCGDNSDEAYCNYTGECPIYMKKCPNSSRCILTEWFCDDEIDCPNGEDEKHCAWIDVDYDKYLAHGKALGWLLQKKDELGMWGAVVDRSAVAFHLTSNYAESDNRKIREEMSYGVSIQILSRLLKRKLKDIPSTDLASFVNAMIGTCLDPRKFHGFDIVGELRSRVDSQNYTDPIVLLTLCNAGESVTESDKAKLVDAFSVKRRPFWTDVQAMAVMALVCANRQSSGVVDCETIRQMTEELKQHQYSNGSVETVQTTALVLQALLSLGSLQADADDFNVTKAYEQILSTQQLDGSFGSFQNSYYVMPVLNCKSLADVDSDHCEKSAKDGSTALDDLLNSIGSKIRVRYSIWIGNGRDLEKNMVLRVPTNASFYEVIEWAGEIDDRFRFKYVVKDSKPYVYELSGLQDDPWKGQFWSMYTYVDGKPTPCQESPADIIPKNNELIVMWYRSGTWIE